MIYELLTSKSEAAGHQYIGLSTLPENPSFVQIKYQIDG